MATLSRKLMKQFATPVRRHQSKSELRRRGLGPLADSPGKYMYSDKFLKHISQGMQVRRQVMGDTFVDNSLRNASATEIGMSAQELATEVAWGTVSLAISSYSFRYLSSCERDNQRPRSTWKADA